MSETAETKQILAVGLLRVSTREQGGDDRAGLLAQGEANLQTAKRYGLKIVKTITVCNVSGAQVLRSPQVQELLRLIESPKIKAVICREFSRLMRPENFADFVMLQAFADTETVLYLPEGPVDFGSRSGRLFGGIRALMAGAERTEILERVWASKEEKRKSGRLPQSEITLPFGVGYDRKEERWFYKPEVEKVRKAFEIFLAGETSYWAVGRRLGITPTALRLILRNETYTGTRVYSQKRDSSAKGRYLKSDGRQADRRKVARTNDEIIRVKVLDPVVSKADFDRLQRILDLKKQNHWRCRRDYESRFAYHGFLRCGDCGNLIYTHVRSPHDWYVCKSRTTAERKIREKRNLQACRNPYMRRERLELSIDQLFSTQLTDKAFLGRAVEAYLMRHQEVIDNPKLECGQHELERLSRKRTRVMDAYFEGLISSEDRDRRITEIEATAKFYDDELGRADTTYEPVTTEDVASALSSFFEWKFLSHHDRRRLLQAGVPEIHVKNYQVAGICLLSSTANRNEMSHRDKGSLRPRA